MRNGEFKMNTGLRKKIGTSFMVLLITTSFITVCTIPTMAGMPAPAEPWQDRGMDRPQYHRPAPGIWRNPQTVQELGLSEKQVNQLRDADFASREKQLELKAQLDSLRLQMDKAFSGDSVDDKTVHRLAEEIAGIQGDLFVQNVESRLTVGKILSADQMDMLKRHRLHPEKKGPCRGAKSVVSHDSIERPVDIPPSTDLYE
jgi:Spy/CpxP family protein refolding chaperone